MPRQIRQKFLLALLLLLLPSAIVAQQTGNMFPVSLLYPGGGNNIIQASDGMLYGTSVDDGYDGGIIFQIDPTTGTYKKIYAFNSVTDGEVPNSIIEGSDGELYGTNIYGGNNQRVANLRGRICVRHRLQGLYCRQVHPAAHLHGQLGRL
jgi:uncharacterized repeat protein (TIGR03803 family)